MEKSLQNRFLNSDSDNNRKSKIQNRILAGIVALVVAFAMCWAVAQAQQQKKVPRIGYLTVASLSSNVARVDAFRRGLRELGYVEGKISSLSGDLQRGNSNARVNSRPN
jgi:hypothetical protein